MLLNDIASATVQSKSLLMVDPQNPTAIFIIKSKAGTISFELLTQDAGLLVEGMHVLIGSRFHWPEPLPGWIASLGLKAGEAASASAPRPVPRKISSTTYRDPYRNPSLRRASDGHWRTRLCRGSDRRAGRRFRPAT